MTGRKSRLKNFRLDTHAHRMLITVDAGVAGHTPGNWTDVPGVADFGVDELRPGAKDPAALVWLLPQ